MMNKTKTIILKKLLDKYYKSKAYTENSERAKPALSEKEIRNLFSDTPYSMNAYSTYGKPDFIQEVNNNLKDLERQNYINIDKKSETFPLYSRIYLNTDKIQEISDKLGLKTRDEINENIIKILKEYEKNHFFDKFIKEQYTNIENKKVVKYTQVKGKTDLERFENILKAVDAIVSQEDEIYLRILSSDLYGNSKYLESIIKTVCDFIISYSNENYDFLEKETDILPLFNILKSPGYIYIKGNGKIIFTNGVEYELFRNNFGILSTELKNIKEIKVENKKIITIENLTTFNAEDEKDAFYIYLAGYHNSVRCNFLKKLYKNNMNIPYYHFGDIDSGGFYIFSRLKKETRIPFTPYKMSEKDLEEKREYWIELSKNDRNRLNSILENEDMQIFHDTVKYMLKNNCKIEQEIFQI